MSASDCAFLFLTEACNLRCSHCYVEAGPGVGIEMPAEIIDASLRLFSALGICDVRLTGGEATVHSRFGAIVKQLHSSGVRVGLVTNGIRLLRDSGEPSTLDMLSRCWVSLYGATARSHSLVSGRPEDTFGKTISRVGDLAQRGHWIGLSVLLNPGEGAAIPELVRMIAAAGVKRLRFLPLDPDGRARESDRAVWRQWPKELARVVQALKESDTKDLIALTINDPFDALREFEHVRESCLLRTRQMWSVVPNGDVFPCCFSVTSPGQRIGNVLDEGIHEILMQRIGQHVPACRGLSAAFWRGAVSSASCPIRSIDPRTA